MFFSCALFVSIFVGYIEWAGIAPIFSGTILYSICNADIYTTMTLFAARSKRFAPLGKVFRSSESSWSNRERNVAPCRYTQTNRTHTRHQSDTKSHDLRSRPATAVNDIFSVHVSVALAGKPNQLHKSAEIRYRRQILGGWCALVCLGI